MEIKRHGRAALILFKNCTCALTLRDALPIGTRLTLGVVMLPEGLRLKEDGVLSLNEPNCLLGARRGRFILRLLIVPELAGLPKLTLIVDLVD